MGLHSSDVRMWQRAQQREVAVSLGVWMMCVCVFVQVVFAWLYMCVHICA